MYPSHYRFMYPSRTAGPRSAVGSMINSRARGPRSIPGPAYFRFSFLDSRRAVVSYWRKYVHEVLVNHLGDISLPRKSVVRLTDCPDMTIDFYHGRKTTTTI